MNKTDKIFYWHSLEKKEVLAELKTSEEGLSNKEALFRLGKYGVNELKQVSRSNIFLIFFEQFKSVFILILFVAALFSFFIGHYFDFGLIVAIIILNAVMGFFQQYKAEKIISEMKKMLVPKVKVIRAGRVLEIASLEIVPGDILSVSEGDKITADCRLLDVNELQTNEAVLTGESFPQNKSTEKVPIEIELADREGMIYAGTSVARGSARAVVVSTGMATEFGRIAKLVQEIKPARTPLQEKLDSFSKKVAIVVLVLAVITTIVGTLRGEDIFQMLLTGVALAVSVIPEGLPAVIAITLAFAIKKMQKYNALVRKLPAAETLGRTTVICTDKTGTLTEEKMSVAAIHCDNKHFEIIGGNFLLEGKKVSPEKNKELMLLLRIGIMCNNARLEIKDKNTEVFGDPTENALVLSAYSSGLIKGDEVKKEIRIKEYSFSSNRKMMSIVREKGDQLVSYTKGAPDIILKHCDREMADGKIIDLTDKRKIELHSIYENMAAKALRVLAFAFKEVPTKFNQEIAENELVFAGLQGMLDIPRKEVKAAIGDCISAGIKIKMVTGDSVITAKAVSEMIGLIGDSIEGRELEKLSEKEFNDAVKEKAIFARINPELKFKIVRCLKKQKEVVAVTGDGVNDILALKEAHIGIAMGIRGTDVARDVSDIILLDDNFTSIVSAVREGRRVYDNMKKSITAHITANVDEMFVVLFALLLAWPLPLMPLAILWMNLITDSLPCLSLSFEPQDKNIMGRKPISQKETILTGITGFLLIAGTCSFVVT
ncbi:MAG: HAD-IC family P-type ATPase, partial [Patescibacteria group bacterium]|nr:HAD-IC family P-type ATPase [Patescibacteria group bacterium]